MHLGNRWWVNPTPEANFVGSDWLFPTLNIACTTINMHVWCDHLLDALNFSSWNCFVLFRICCSRETIEIGFILSRLYRTFPYMLFGIEFRLHFKESYSRWDHNTQRDGMFSVRSTRKWDCCRVWNRIPPLANHLQRNFLDFIYCPISSCLLWLAANRNQN